MNSCSRVPRIYSLRVTHSILTNINAKIASFLVIAIELTIVLSNIFLKIVNTWIALFRSLAHVLPTPVFLCWTCLSIRNFELNFENSVIILHFLIFNLNYSKDNSTRCISNATRTTAFCNNNWPILFWHFLDTFQHQHCSKNTFTFLFIFFCLFFFVPGSPISSVSSFWHRNAPPRNLSVCWMNFFHVSINWSVIITVYASISWETATIACRDCYSALRKAAFLEEMPDNHQAISHIKSKSRLRSSGWSWTRLLSMPVVEETSSQKEGDFGSILTRKGPLGLSK